ncbi:MAG: Smr/MutS family protein [Lewinellaceae bacterium]|nr:Smr/MutS family protein [Lewinellaceae bacterium]
MINGYARLDKGEILRIQLQHCHRFVEKAVRLGAPRVFLIHGVGEGKLKDAIAEQLRANPYVVKFKNEYHHKYGYGATEVIF